MLLSYRNIFYTIHETVGFPLYDLSMMILILLFSKMLMNLIDFFIIP